MAYLTDAGGKRQIHVRWLDTGETALVTNVQESPGSLIWSPNGRWIAFTMAVAAESKPVAKPRKAPDGATWAPAPKTISSVRYQYDGRGIVEPAYRHVFVVPADGGTPRQLTEGDFNHDDPAWHPDSKSLLVSANRDPNWALQTDEANLYRIDLASARMSTVTDAPGAERSPTWSPDGRHIAYLAEARRPLAWTPEILMVMDADGTAPRALTAGLDAAADGPLWAEDSKRLYFTYDERAVRKVARVRLNGRIEEVATGLGGTTIGRPYLSGGFHTAGGTVAFTRGFTDRPAELAVVDGNRTRQLTDLNGDLIDYRQMGDVTEVNYTSSFDGTPIQGWYITPPDFDPGKQYPLVLEIHGGPHLAYGPYFSAELQLMAAAGYVVFYDNHRGSTSYGEDFALLLQHKYSSREDFADHMSGVDEMIATGFIDPNELFIAGGSAGGIATAYAIGLTDRFSAAVAAKPVINWISKTLTADSSVGQIYHQFPGMPWDHLEHYWQRSPLSLVGNVTTPTMLLTGEDDRRTPMSETEQFYQALNLRGVDTVMVRLPDTAHGIAGRPSRLIAKVDNMLAWFERYRTGE